MTAQDNFRLPLGRLVALALATGLLTGCASKGTSTTSPSSSSDVASAAPSPASAMGFCVDEINRYRATLNLPALSRSSALEDYATDSARIDQAARQAHMHFTSTNGGGVARAETELLLWPNPDAKSVLQQGLKVMWTEGPNGSHYDVLTGAYSSVGCGIFVEGSVMTISQDFR